MFRKSKGSTFVGLWMSVVLVLSLFSASSVSAETTHTITVTPPVNGTITPGGAVVVADSANKRFTITPDLHYHIADVIVDKGTLGERSVLDQLTRDPVNPRIYYYKFIAVTANHTIEASFSIDTPTLTILKTGPGAANGIVTSDPAGIDCGISCANEYDWGTSVQLTASVVPDSGAVFKGWVVAGVLVSKNPQFTVKMNKNKKISAKFAQTYTLNITKDGVGAGTVKSYLIAGINCGADCDNVYPAGKKITLVATPDSASKFTAWSGDVAGATKKITVTMDGNKTVNATFDEKAQPIKMTKKVSVVESPGTTAPKPLRIGRVGLVPGDLPPDSDYFNDQTNVYIEERSAQTFELANEILCSIAQTKYDEMLNKGNYKAMVDKNLCKSAKDDPSSAGAASGNNSSGATMPDYELWTMNSSRADDNPTTPQIVKAWIHQKGNDSEQDLKIFAKAVIEKGMDEVPPFGLFTVTFKAYPDIDVPLEYLPIIFKGFLKTEQDDTGKVLLKFVDQANFTLPGKNETIIWKEQATLDIAADGSTGGGTAYAYDEGPWSPDPEESTFDFAYDNSYFKRQEKETSVETCLSRIPPYDESVWSYGLYDSIGTRVNRHSGDSIKAKVGPKEYYGWIGYWGVWFPKDVTITNGQTVYKFNPGPGGGEPELYQALISGGKLKKHVKKEATLGQIKNIPLDYRDMIDQKSYRLKWDGTNFKKFEWLDEANNYMWVKIDPPEDFDLTHLDYDILTFWSQALNGNVQILLNYLGECVMTPGNPPVFSCPASDSTPVNFYTQTIVYPDDTLPDKLVCFNSCPDADALESVPNVPNLPPPDDPACTQTCQDQWNTYFSWNPFVDYSYPQIGVLPGAADHQEYKLDKTTMVLQRFADSKEVLYKKAHLSQQWGLLSGSLFDPVYLDLLACELIPGAPDPDSTCGYKGWSELPEFYSWETGPNEYNHFTALKHPDTGEVLEYDPPLLVSYNHTWEDLTQSTFYLEYSGFGNLHGIPGKCVDADTGLDAPCSFDTRWIPEFTIPEGSEMTDATDNVTKYLAKPLEMEQRMHVLSLSDCDGLTLTSYPLPQLQDGYTDPNIGNEPVVEGPPAVIGGVVQ